MVSALGRNWRIEEGLSIYPLKMRNGGFVRSLHAVLTNDGEIFDTSCHTEIGTNFSIHMLLARSWAAEKWSSPRFSTLRSNSVTDASAIIMVPDEDNTRGIPMEAISLFPLLVERASLWANSICRSKIGGCCLICVRGDQICVGISQIGEDETKCFVKARGRLNARMAYIVGAPVSYQTPYLACIQISQAEKVLRSEVDSKHALHERRLFLLHIVSLPQ